MKLMTVKENGIFFGFFIFLFAISHLSGETNISLKDKGAPSELPKSLPLLKPTATTQTAAMQQAYTHPGIVVWKDGTWEGNDYLYNLTNQIGVEVEIHKPVEVMLDLSESKLKSIVETIFQKSGIIATARNSEDEPSLPFYHVEILIYPIEKGYAVGCEARLFEAVSTKRVILEKGTALQVITWEKQTLMVVPTENTVALIEKTVGEMAESFAQLFQFYELLKKR